MSGHRPLVILGLDTGDPDAIEQWVAEGHLPTIAGLMRRGAWGRTGGAELVCEYGVGLTLFSGVSRRDHGYYYFRQLEPETYDLVTVAPPTEAAPPFWWALRETDRRVLILDVPDNRPLAGLAGLQLANWATHHGSKYPPEAEPASLHDEALRVFGPQMRISSQHAPGADAAREIRDRLLERVRRKGALARDMLARGPFDLSVIFFSETDAASHALWRFRPEAAGAQTLSDEERALTHGLCEVYAAVDREIGELVDRLPEDADVFVVSLYGCQDEYPTSTLIGSFLGELGYHRERSGGGAANGAQGRDPLALVRRLVPLHVREAIGRRLPEAGQERLLAERLRTATDWSRTSAFAVPSLFTSFVRINLIGREPQGIVAPGAEYDDLLTRLEDDLRMLVDADTGKPAVRRAVRTTGLFGGPPPPQLPDLFVEWQPGPTMLTRVSHPRATLVQPQPGYCPDSQEKLTGFLAAAGPSVRPCGDLGEVDLLDLAPTFLRLLGCDAGMPLRGRPLPTLLV